MIVAREAQYEQPGGVELTLADLGLLVSHLQTVGQAPPEARVLLRDRLIRVEWSTHQESDAELRAQAEAARLEREQRAMPTAAIPSDVSVADSDDVEEYLEPAEEPLAVPARPRRGSSLV